MVFYASVIEILTRPQHFKKDDFPASGAFHNKLCAPPRQMIQFFLVQLKAQAKLKKCFCKVLKTSGVIALNPLLSSPGGGLIYFKHIRRGGEGHI